MQKLMLILKDTNLVLIEWAYGWIPRFNNHVLKRFVWVNKTSGNKQKLCFLSTRATRLIHTDVKQNLKDKKDQVLQLFQKIHSSQ